MAKIEKLKKDVAGVSTTIYPVTIPQAVIDPTSGKSARAELDEKANHGYESGQKTLKAVDDAKVDKTSIVGETGQGETTVMHQKAVTDELSAKANHGYESNPKTLKEVDDNLAQLAGDVSELGIKDAIQSDKIKDIENVISTMNPNQSAQLSVSGRKVVSLPKNASNGGMEIKLEGLTADNLVANGDFSSSTGWITTPVGTIVNGEFVATSMGNPPWIQQLTNVSIGDKVYFGGIVYSLSGSGFNNTPFIKCRDSVGSTDLSNTTSIPTRLSAIRTIAGDGVAIYLNDYYSGTVDHHFDKIFAINLTKIFGSGNEPDLATCDAMFSDYFEGVKSFYPTGRVRSVGKNLFNINTAYIERADTIAVVNGSILTVIGLFFVMTPLIRVEKNKNYYISTITTQESGAGLNTVVWGNGVPTNSLKSGNGVFNTGNYDRVSIAFYSGAGSQSVATFTNILLARSNVATLYTPYTHSSLYLSAPELRSNGLVKDEIRKGANGYEIVKRISDVDGTVLATPVISPINYGGILNSAESGTVYHEPVIADAGVYGTNMPILLTDYPIATIEEIIKHEGGVDTYLNASTAVIAPDGLSFTHPNLTEGDLVLFTYAYSKESTNGNITATFYDSNVVKIDTVTGKAYKITDVVTDGVLTRTLTEV